MTIWFDVTTVLKWHRPAVGVVRVETEVARFLLGRDVGIYQFCRFDNAQKRFYHVSRDEVSQKLAELESLNSTSSNIENAQAPLVQSFKLPLGQSHGRTDRFHPAVYQSIRIIKKPFVGMMIAGWKSFHAIRSHLDSARTSPTALPGRLRTASLSKMTESGQEDAGHPFANDDVYISVGMDWEYKDWEFLLSLRAALRLKTLLCCYDLIPIAVPGVTTTSVAERFPAYIIGLAKCADKLMCISSHTKNDLEMFLGQSGQALPDSEVFYLGTDIALDSTKVSPSPQVQELIEETSYIMLVSTIERRKGHDTVYRAYQRLVEQGFADLPLLIFVGMPGWGVDDLLADIQRTKHVSKYIRFLSHVSDRELTLLYRHCLFTVFPSIYEGWGLPVSESLTHGKFCLASSAASIPEAGGEFCEYLDPWNVPLWTERLAFYFAHQSAVQEKEKIILQNYKPHTWLEAASSIVLAVDSLAET
jgi:glycosyltransferase involved in cell wall biosynthesis